MILGSVTFSVDPGFAPRVYSFLAENRIEAASICESGGRLRLTVGAENAREIKAFLDKSSCEYETVRVTGLLRWLGIVRSKKGLVLGILLSAVLIRLMSGVIFRIEIASDDPALRQQILDVLSDNGIAPGRKTDKTDLTVVERQIKARVDGVGWVGISLDGSRLIVDIVDYTSKPEFTGRRLPTNIVSLENGTIDKVELLDGQLMKPVGSGVAKGDIIVSGEVVTDKLFYRDGKEEHEIKRRYTRSLGSIYGTFERRVTFEQDLISETTAFSGEEKNIWSVELFDLSLPAASAKGSYTVTETERFAPELFGLKLPVSLKKSTVREYSTAAHTLTEEQAFAAAEEQAEKYERNFLSGFEIKDRQVQRRTGEEGVTLEINYTLYGQIGKEVDFFIKK